MARTLLLMRHAKSAWDTDAPSDFERPLAKRGKRDATTMGEVLRTKGLVPDRVLVSGAKRARKTAKRVLAAMDVDRERVVVDDRLYQASLPTLETVLRGATGETVMLVGHIPDLEVLLRHLAKKLPEAEDGKLLPTGAVAVLRVPDDFSRLPKGSATLLDILRPRDHAED